MRFVLSELTLQMHLNDLFQAIALRFLILESLNKKKTIIGTCKIMDVFFSSRVLTKSFVYTDNRLKLMSASIKHRGLKTQVQTKL